jgi:hypothetical protein
MNPKELKINGRQSSKGEVINALFSVMSRTVKRIVVEIRRENIA